MKADSLSLLISDFGTLYRYFPYSTDTFTNLILQKGLMSVDSMPRKQGLFLLKNVIELPLQRWESYIAWDTFQWQLFFSLYEALDESKSHLLKVYSLCLFIKAYFYMLFLAVLV